jgi:hypothetical protein
LLDELAGELLSAADPEPSEGAGALGAITAGGRAAFGDIGCCCNVGALAAVGFFFVSDSASFFFCSSLSFW